MPDHASHRRVMPPVLHKKRRLVNDVPHDVLRNLLIVPLPDPARPHDALVRRSPILLRRLVQVQFAGRAPKVRPEVDLRHAPEEHRHGRVVPQRPVVEPRPHARRRRRRRRRRQECHQALKRRPRRLAVLVHLDAAARQRPQRRVLVVRVRPHGVDGRPVRVLSQRLRGLVLAVLEIDVATERDRDPVADDVWRQRVGVGGRSEVHRRVVRPRDNLSMERQGRQRDQQSHYVVRPQWLQRVIGLCGRVLLCLSLRQELAQPRPMHRVEFRVAHRVAVSVKSNRGIQRCLPSRPPHSNVRTGAGI